MEVKPATVKSYNSVKNANSDKKANLQKTSSNAKNEKTKHKFGKIEKDIFDSKLLKKFGVVDDYARILNPFLLMSKNPLMKMVAPAAYAASGVYMAADVINKARKGEDGTGEKPSFKVGLRQALYHGAINVALPIGIVKGTQNLAVKLFEGSKTAARAKVGTGIAEKFVRNSTAKGILKNASMPAKIVGALASMFVLSKAMKPLSFVADKLFKITVDPLFKIGKKEKTENKAKEEKLPDVNPQEDLKAPSEKAKSLQAF